MNNFEKVIYNNFLEVSKKVNNRPVKYRKDFNNFPDDKYIFITKLSRFFNKFDSIKIKDFFEAPYFVYGENYFDLKFYLSQKAIKAYTLYNDNYILNNPDSTNTLDKLKESVSFIYKYCKDNNIKLKDYLTYKEGSFNVFLKHIKQRDINFFILFSFDNLNKVLDNIDISVKTIYSNNFNKINYLRTKYYSSSKAKIIVTNFKKYVENE
jgi:hypothetical protein|tara:strand:+ start:613 stop:1239 length:627 start_codon:yes stop_codon:yes gene_type:complete